MFGFLKNNKPAPRPAPAIGSGAVGCFGKLPIRADFIKYNASHREVVALDQWIQEGYGLMSRRTNGAGPDAFVVKPVHHVVFTGTQHDRTVLATLVPSEDRSGRRYPFVIFNLTGQPYLYEAPTALPLAYDAFFAKAAELAGQHWRNEPFETLTAHLDIMREGYTDRGRRDLVEREFELLQQTDLALLWDGIAPALGDIPREHLLHALVETLKTVSRRGPHRTHWGLRLPLPAGEGRLGVLTFWLRTADSILGRDTWRPNYFWSEASAAGGGALTVFFRPAPSHYLAHCFEAAPRDGSVLDMLEEAGQVETAGRTAREVAAFRQGSLLDLLRRVASEGGTG